MSKSKLAEEQILALILIGEIVAFEDGTIGRFVWYKNGDKDNPIYSIYNSTIRDKNSKNKYVVLGINYHSRVITCPAHRAVWMYYNQKLIPDDHVIHHINGIRNDNRIENLVCMESKKHCKLKKRLSEEVKKKYIRRNYRSGKWVSVRNTVMP